MKNGRNFEYVSGEDPVLGAAMAPQIVAGINKNVMSIAKHYIVNNQETHRSGVNELVDERTLMELYGPPFRAAVQHASGVMCAYNRINGVYACENELTQMTMLKGRYGFAGFIVSDWGATHSTVPALQAGLDIQMPNDSFFNNGTLAAAVAAGNITAARVDDSCVRILTGWYAVPAARRYPCTDAATGSAICIGANVTSAAHKDLAKRIASLSTVLLKNEGGVLPLSATPSAPLAIALIGTDADDAYTAGGGSGSVKTNDMVSPLAAFSQVAADSNGMITVTYTKGAHVDDAVAAAAAADVAFVFGSAHTSEGSDRKSLNLEANVDALIPAVGAACKKTVVALSVPGSILTDWRDSAAAILWLGLPGEKVGPALADVVFGAVPPQAKLPVTLPKVDNEQNMTATQWPGVKTANFDLQCKYSEGQFNGYRWYDQHNVAPAFPFGHGLTYGGAFEYGAVSVTKASANSTSVTESSQTNDQWTASFTISRKATSAAGCDTPQLYFGYPSWGVDKAVPRKVLRNFQKVCHADPAQDFAQVVSYTFGSEAIRSWDEGARAWGVVTGAFKVYVGTSSQAIKQTATFVV